MSTFLREKRNKNLNRNDLEDISKELNNFFTEYKIIELINIHTDVWNDVKSIAERSHLYSSDVLHLALTRMHECHVLVTHDSFFIKEGNRLLKKAGEVESLRICNPQNIKKIIKKVTSN